MPYRNVPLTPEPTLRIDWGALMSRPIVWFAYLIRICYDFWLVTAAIIICTSNLNHPIYWTALIVVTIFWIFWTTIFTIANLMHGTQARYTPVWLTWTRAIRKAAKRPIWKKEEVTPPTSLKMSTLASRILKPPKRRVFFLDVQGMSCEDIENIVNKFNQAQERAKKEQC